MNIKTAQDLSDLEKFFPLLKELRPLLSWDEFLNIYEAAHKKDQYELVGFFEGDLLVGLMGHRVLDDFVRGRHLYIDDLVTKESHRSTGLGKTMLEYAIEHAKEINCPGGLRLCTGLDNDRGIKFYEKNGWKARAYAFTFKFKN